MTEQNQIKKEHICSQPMNNTVPIYSWWYLCNDCIKYLLL